MESLEKTLIIPRGAQKRTAKQLEQMYQDRSLRTLSDDYAMTHVWLVAPNEMMPVCCGNAMVVGSDRFDYVTFAKEVAERNQDLHATQAIVTFYHKLYTECKRGKKCNSIMDAYHWEFRREVVSL